MTAPRVTRDDLITWWRHAERATWAGHPPARIAMMEQWRAALAEDMLREHALNVADREVAETVLRVAHGLVAAGNDIARAFGTAHDGGLVVALTLLGDTCRRTLE